MVNLLLLAGPESEWKLPDAAPAGFWIGLWHGLILPVAFLISLFSRSVRIYEANNVGLWYDFGFMLGASSSLGGSGGVAT